MFVAPESRVTAKSLTLTFHIKEKPIRMIDNFDSLAESIYERSNNSIDLTEKRVDSRLRL